MQFSSFLPLWLLLGCAAASVFAWRRSLVDRPPLRKWLAHGLRLLGVVCLVLALCRPYWLSRSDDLHVIYLVDVSESVDPGAMRTAAGEIEQAARSLRGSDRASVLSFAAKLTPSDPTTLRKLADEADRGTADATVRDSTRLAEALLGSRLVFDAGMARRLVVFSDGAPTSSGVADAIKTLEQEGVDVRFRRIDGLKRPEAAIVALEPMTRVAYRGEVVRMRLRLRANEAMNATARILHGGVSVASTPVKLEAGKETAVTLDVAMTATGESRWEAELQPEKDWFPVNNKVATTITVKGEPRLLVLHRDEKQMRPLARALKKQGIELELRGERGLPDTMAEMLAFDAVVLADVPATAMNLRQMELLKRYVSDFGGGLAMLGSEDSFGLGGYYRTPVEEALPLTSRYEKEKQKPSLAMALVIDKSGSMSGERIALARASAKAAAELLGAQDQIAVIGFDSAPQVILNMTSAADKGTVLNAIDSLEAGGGTDAYPAMVKGKELLQNSVAKVKHMIVLSDGETPDYDFPGLVRDMRSQGMTVSSVCLGEGGATELMKMIAQEGGGRYYETSEAANLPQIFTKETMQASRSAIKEDLYATVVTGDHPMLSGYEKSQLPYVLGYVMTQPKPSANLLLAAETGDPLLAVCRYGLGTGLCWTSDLTEKWGGEWLGWGNGGAFWAQVFRGIVRKEQSAGLAASGSVDRETWLVNITRRDEQDRPVDRVKWDAKAIDANGVDVPAAVRQTGVGRYEASVDLAGRDRVNLSLRDPDHALMKTLGWQRDYPAEYRLDRETDSALAALPEFDPAAVRADMPNTAVYQDIAHWFVYAGFACLIGGIAVRRI
ncbi:VWA domain-containing protein [Luteolibacter ambystomatis]|uniref:VWA domain-containing protein n=1 Tax=Luteolibacter ambystomatis TaxID=2824561 RepID=A0A975GA18_9BACT|nr:VWA domain-containing protein [Luteolibacter ambystomatis]QUE51205.1 VWA domain-containing protein [Luteolibacter ambystomatis]